MAIVSKTTRDLAPATTSSVKALTGPADETGGDLVFLSDSKVRQNYTWRPSANAREEQKTSVFDFARVSKEQLIKLAMYACKVKVQHHLRTLANTNPGVPVPKDTYATIDVLRDIIEATNVVDPVARMVQTMRRAGVDEAHIMATLKMVRK